MGSTPNSIKSINADLRSLRDRQISHEPELQVPEHQTPGLQFIYDDGHINLRPSGIASDEDLKEINRLRVVLKEQINTLIELMRRSNAHSAILPASLKYQEAISARNLSIDLLYAHGEFLQNVRKRVAEAIKSDVLPEMPIDIGAILDHVITLHSALIPSTKRGKQLIERASGFSNA